MLNRSHGFTLIELLIVVTIIGVIAALALPGYDAYIQRGNRTVAKTVLSEVASRQESFFTDRKTYATTLSALGYPADTFYISKSGVPSAATTGAMYSVTLPAASATSFTVTATVVAGGPQRKDTDCNTLSITNTGTKSATKKNGDPGSTDCWTR